MLAVGLAAALSLLTPVGPAEYAEPSPGFDFAPTIMLGGALVLLVVFVAVGTIPAWNNARHDEHVGALHGSATAGWLAARGASPALTTGVRFALEPGRGSTAVPTRATIIGAITAVTVAAATIVFASSLDRVVNDGRFYGSNFDLAIDFDEGLSSDQAVVDGVLATVAADPAVERVGELRITEVTVDDVAVTSLAFADSDEGDPVVPTIAAGRAPEAADEIALGSDDDARARRRDRRHRGARHRRVRRRRHRRRAGGAAGHRPLSGLRSDLDRRRGVWCRRTRSVRATDATKSFIVVGLDPSADAAEARTEFEDRMASALGEREVCSSRPTGGRRTSKAWPACDRFPSCWRRSSCSSSA